jgi:LAS superfamily LD-carboxypeptidase LdcB
MIGGSRYLSGLWPPFAGAVQYLLEWGNYQGLSGEIISGYRSLQEQAELYAIGRTPEEVAAHVSKQGRDGSVTDAVPGQSAHNYGLAVDFDNPDIRHLAAVIGFGTVSWDPAHVEWPGWRRIVMFVRL